MSFPELILSSRNLKKAAEIHELLQPHGLVVKSVAEFPEVGEVVEDGASFAENAAKKATEVARQIGRWVLAEDSGLCVDALGGAPGIYSARFAGAQGDDAANNARLLADLADVPHDRRTAYYLCHAVLSDPDGQVRVRAEGTCRGLILREFRGVGGFGYDPLFLIREYHQTFAELAPAVKRHLSHRARAFERLIPGILRVLSELH